MIQPITEAERVLIRGKVFLYKQKAPFVPSGKSVYGALEYDEAMDRVRCHECGEWFRHVGRHASMAHGMSSRNYKILHGLRLSAALCGINVSRHCSLSAGSAIKSRDNTAWLAKSTTPRTKEFQQTRIRRARFAELRNEQNTCVAQLISRVQELGQSLGATPSRAEMRAAGIHVRSACLALGVKNLKELTDLCGFAPRISKKSGAKAQWSKQLLRDLLTNFYVRNGRLPKILDFSSGLLPSYPTYRRYFGSIQDAYEAAGLALVAKRAKSASAQDAPMSIAS